MSTIRKEAVFRVGAMLLLLVGLIMGLGVLSSSLVAAPDDPPQINILAIGDSNTYGFSYVDKESPQPAGWPKKDGLFPEAWAGKTKADRERASYRLPLYQLLKRQSNYSFGLVGNEYAPADKDYDDFSSYPSEAGYAIPSNPATELAFVGWPSKTTVDINGTNEKWGLSTALAKLTGNKVPNVALIHLGTNDINRPDKVTPTDSVEALNGLVTKLAGKNRNIRIYVALIIPTGYPGQYCDDNNEGTDPFGNGLRTFAASCASFAYDWLNESPVEAFNRRVVDWCQPKQETPGTGFNTRRCDADGLKDSYIYLVDMHAGFDSENWLLPSDEVHPTRHGECQIAWRWYEGLRETAYPNLPAPPAGFCNVYDEGYVARPAPGQTSRVSVHLSGLQGYRPSDSASVSGDGRYIAFSTGSDMLVPFDTNGYSDILVHDRATGETERVSVDSLGRQANGYSGLPSISDNGRYVAFYSLASNLVEGDTNDKQDIFVHDRTTGETKRVSVDSAGNQANDESFDADISPDGRYVAYASRATNLVSGDTNGVIDVFVYDTVTGSVRRVSVDSAGNQGDAVSSEPAISQDGKYVAFASAAGNLTSGDDKGRDIFVHVMSTGVTERVSVNSQPTSELSTQAFDPDISADGRYVVFDSSSEYLVPGESNRHSDIFLVDRTTDVITRVSVHSNGSQSNDYSDAAVISADGRYIAYQSYATNLVDGDTHSCPDPFYPDYTSCSDVFLYDRQTGSTTRESVDSSGGQTDDESFYPAISANGRVLAFESYANNLVSDDTNRTSDVFVRQLSGSPPAPTPTPEPTATTSATGTPSPTPSATPSSTPTATPSGTPVPPSTVHGEVSAGPGGGHVEHDGTMYQDNEIFELDPDQPIRLVGDVGVDYYVACADGQRRFLSQENFAPTGEDSEVLFVPPLSVDCPAIVAGRQFHTALVIVHLLAGGVGNAVRDPGVDLAVKTEWATVEAANKDVFAVRLTGSDETTVTTYRGEVSIVPANPALPPMTLAAGQEVPIGTDDYGPVTHFTFDLYLPAVTAPDLSARRH